MFQERKRKLERRIIRVSRVVHGLGLCFLYSHPSHEYYFELVCVTSAWSVKTWIALAGLPAFLYTIQNVAALMAYQNLEALTFNVLNQTKILSAALSCYFVMGQRQSKMQVISLCFLILSTLVIEQILHPFAFIWICNVHILHANCATVRVTKHT